jgi:hypothetical protein
VLCEINVSSAFAIQIGRRRKSLALRMPDCSGGSVSRDEDPIYSARYLERLLLCWFLDAGKNERAARSTGRRPKSAKARSRGKFGTG